MKNRYDKTKSDMFKEDGRDFSITYGTGHVAGKMVRDKINFGGLESTAAITFGEATEMAKFFKSAEGMDGILGQGWQALSERDVTPVFEQLHDQGVISENSFGFYLTDKPNAAGSKMFVGAANSDYYEGDLFWVPLLERKYWTFQIDGLIRDNSIYNPIKPFKGIMDSGTSLILGTSRIFNTLYIPHLIDENCPGPDSLSGDWGKFPSIGFMINGERFELPPQQYIFKYDGEHCIIGVQDFLPEGNGIDLIIGDVFMKYYYTHFDYTEGRIAINKAKPHNEMNYKITMDN